MRIPRITMTFGRLVGETDRAFRFFPDTWMPKSICHIVRQTKRGCLVNVAPFKYTEMTGIIPQPVNSFEITDNIAPVPQLTDYDIIEPPGISLYASQIDKVVRAKMLRYFFLYGQMRTGKTIIAATIAHSRMQDGMINRVIVIAPLRIENVWRSHLAAIEFVPIEHFSNQHTRDKIELRCNDSTMVILDESHQLKNNDTERVLRVIKQTETSGHRIIMTGTPIGKHAGDLYWQFYFLHPDILGYNSYKSFADTHLIYGGREGKSVVAYANIEEISHKVSPYTVIMRRSEMGIDRQKIYDIRTYQITNRAVYDKLFEATRKCTGDSIFGAMVRLQQCANGYIINELGQVAGYEDNGRKKCLDDLIRELTGKSIVVYFKYNSDIYALGNIPTLSGRTKRKDFTRVIDEFNAGCLKVIAIQQQLSIGFSLRACDVMIYFSRKFGSINSSQSEDRACEKNDQALRIIDICAANTIDQVIKSTINRQFDIINLFKKELRNEDKCKH